MPDRFIVLFMKIIDPGTALAFDLRLIANQLQYRHFTTLFGSLIFKSKGSIDKHVFNGFARKDGQP